MPVLHATHTHERLSLGAEVTDAGLDRSIQEIEDGLTLDDPDFVRRMHREASAETSHAPMIVLLLVASVLLLAIGLMAYAWILFVAGALAFVAASAIDHGARPTNMTA